MITSTSKHKNADIESQIAERNATGVLCEKNAEAFGLIKGVCAEPRVA